MMTEGFRATRLIAACDVAADYRTEVLTCPKRVRAAFGGETVAESNRVLLMRESRHLPVYYFPRADVRVDLLVPGEHTTFCPHKGRASYFSLRVDGRVAENAVWTYEAPYEGMASIKDHVAFYWGKMDHWYEEDEEVFVHARDPFVRLDVLKSAREVRVVLGGREVARTRRARLLFETGLPTRYYIPAEDVDANLLAPSEKVTACPYKGTARYWSTRVGDKLFDDIVWSYPEPLPEALRIKDYLCFYDERVDALEVDGEAPAQGG